MRLENTRDSEIRPLTKGMRLGPNERLAVLATVYTALCMLQVRGGGILQRPDKVSGNMQFDSRTSRSFALQHYCYSTQSHRRLHFRANTSEVIN